MGRDDSGESSEKFSSHFGTTTSRPRQLMVLLVPPAQPQLTHRAVEPFGFVSPRNKYEVDGNAGKNHKTPVARLHRAGNHRDDGDEDGGDQIQDGEDEIHLDRAVQFRLLPP